LRIDPEPSRRSNSSQRLSQVAVKAYPAIRAGNPPKLARYLTAVNKSHRLGIDPGISPRAWTTWAS